MSPRVLEGVRRHAEKGVAMLPPSLYERITHLNRSWEARASQIVNAEERAGKYRDIYGAYTHLMETAFKIESEKSEGEQLVQVVELENRIRGYERTLRRADTEAEVAEPAWLKAAWNDVSEVFSRPAENAAAQSPRYRPA